MRTFLFEAVKMTEMPSHKPIIIDHHANPKTVINGDTDLTKVSACDVTTELVPTIPFVVEGEHLKVGFSKEFRDSLGWLVDGFIANQEAVDSQAETIVKQKQHITHYEEALERMHELNSENINTICKIQSAGFWTRIKWVFTGVKA